MRRCLIVLLAAALCSCASVQYNSRAREETIAEKVMRVYGAAIPEGTAQIIEREDEENWYVEWLDKDGNQLSVVCAMKW
jgi:hypothetical protein